MITECPHCEDDEGFPIQLQSDGAGMMYCPICGEEFEVAPVPDA